MKTVFGFCISLCLALALCGVAIGQETTGEIRGSVKDQSGAVVPNVTVTIKGVDVGFNRTVQTDEKGEFVARQIPPGTYNVSTEASSGFAAQTKDAIQVALGSSTKVDFSATTSVSA